MREPARAGGPRPRHDHRRRRGQGVGRREAAAVDRSRAAPQAASARVRRGDLVARFDHRGRHRRHDSRRRLERRRHHRPDRAPALDHPSRRSHLRARARPHRRNRPAPGARRSGRGCTTRCGGSRSANDGRLQMRPGPLPPGGQPRQSCRTCSAAGWNRGELGDQPDVVGGRISAPGAARPNRSVDIVRRPIE